MTHHLGKPCKTKNPARGQGFLWWKVKDGTWSNTFSHYLIYIIFQNNEPLTTFLIYF